MTFCWAYSQAYRLSKYSISMLQMIRTVLNL